MASRAAGCVTTGPILSVFGTEHNRGDDFLLTCRPKTSTMNPMRPTSAHFRLMDRELNGQLEEILRRLHAEVGSWESVSRRLLADYGQDINGQTLRRWAKQLGIGVEAPAA
jgi:hypothetical protein